jgi:hypothetical protein
MSPDKNTDPLTQPRSLEDNEIVTERKLSRRSFVASAGALLAGGAVAIVAERRAQALQVTPNDPNSQQRNDPNNQQPNDPNSQQRNDPNYQQPNDPNSQRTDPNNQRTDPDSKSDPHQKKHRKHKDSDEPDK